jgi:class 3 adenylate cyclase
VIVHGALARGTRAPDYEASWGPDEFEAWYDKIERDWGQPAFVRDLFQELSPSLAHDEQLVRTFGRLLRLSASPGDAIARDRAVEETDVRHILPTVQAPTLVLHRTGDRLELVEQGRYIAAHTPGARLVELPGEDHIYPLDDLIPHIASFVESLRVEEAEFERVLATVLYTDIVDSTTHAATLGDARWQDVRGRHDAIVRSQIGRFRGREIKTMGDGFLVTFDGPARGVKCARTISEAVRSLGIEIRAGLHTGEVAFEGDDVAGLGVAIGARVSALARPSEVLVSQTVKDLVAGSGLAFEDAGEHELKGVPDRWRLYRVEDR